jgi:hypothetical protein
MTLHAHNSGDERRRRVHPLRQFSAFQRQVVVERHREAKLKCSLHTLQNATTCNFTHTTVEMSADAVYALFANFQRQVVVERHREAKLAKRRRNAHR